MAIYSAAKIVQACNEAKESQLLDLTECDLVQIPHALYLMLMSTPPVHCIFSRNKLKSIPGKFPSTFNKMESLILDNNKLEYLPTEMKDLTALSTLNISQNDFKVFPECLYDLKNLKQLDIGGNEIEQIDCDRLEQMTSLEELKAFENPLSDETLMRLKQIKKIKLFI